jgi:hypothetical protein
LPDTASILATITTDVLLAATEAPDTAAIVISGDYLAIAATPIGARAIAGGLPSSNVLARLDATEAQDVAAITIVPSAAYTLVADASSFTYEGKEALLRASRSFVGEPGFYDYVGYAARVPHGFNLRIYTEPYLVTGSAARLFVTRRLASDATTFTYQGYQAAISRGQVLPAAPSAYVLAGNAAQFAVVRKLVAASAAYVFTGNSAALRREYRLSAAQRAFLYTGQPAPLRFGRKVVANSGVYAFTGNAARIFESSFIYDDIEKLIVPWELKTLSVIPSIYADETLDLIVEAEQRLLEVAVEGRILYVDPRARY